MCCLDEQVCYTQTWQKILSSIIISELSVIRGFQVDNVVCVGVVYDLAHWYRKQMLLYETCSFIFSSSTFKEPVNNISMEGDLLLWDVPDGRISFYVVKYFNEQGDESLVQETDEPYIVLPESLIGSFSVQVHTSMYGVMPIIQSRCIILCHFVWLPFNCISKIKPFLPSCIHFKG